MLTVSFEAKELIADDARFSPDLPLRLVVGADDSFDLRPSSPDTTDLTFSHLGRTLLVVPLDVAGRLDGKELDVAVTEEGPRLALRDRAAQAWPPIH